MESDASFEYTYSAPEQEEIKRIRDKYMPQNERETKLERLRRLDTGVTTKGTVWSLILGIISALVMGAGMSMCMVAPSDYLLPGIVVGVAGMLGAALAYPLFKYLTRKERERVTPEIMKLTEELLQ